MIHTLGIKSGWRLLILNAPQNYTKLIEEYLSDISWVSLQQESPVEFVHAYFTHFAELEQTLQTLRQRILPNGMIWISWPQASTGVVTDLDENRIRDLALQHQLIGVKVVALDQTWAGLNLVIRGK